MPLAEFLQTTATINTGNSGGPMFNMAGEVIGIVSQNISKSGGSEGLGFVVTINSARKLLVDRKVFWGALQGYLLTGDLAAIFNVPAPAGFLVKTVAQGSMAWNMGLQGGDRIVTIGGKEIALGGDIILSVDGIPVVSEDNIEKIRNRLAAAPLGTPFKMNVLRAGKVIELTGTASNRAPARAVRGSDAPVRQEQPCQPNRAHVSHPMTCPRASVMHHPAWPGCRPADCRLRYVEHGRQPAGRGGARACGGSRLTVEQATQRPRGAPLRAACEAKATPVSSTAGSNF